MGGKKPLCELTGRPATYQMVTPYLTLFYCSKKAAETSWTGIMHKLCPLLGPLRSKPSATGSEEERLRRKKTLELSLSALVDLTRQEASKFLQNAQYELALPGALQSLKFAQQVHGKQHIELVPPLLLLAEVNLGLNSLKQAERHLSRGNWIILKNPTASNSLRSQLNRNFGKLYALQGKHTDALRHMAHDIYYLSLELGPEHIETAVGYFNMSNIFLAQSRVEQGLAFYDKVVDIWYKFMANVRSKTAQMEMLEMANTTQAVNMLNKILRMRIKFLGHEHIATGEVMFTVGLVHLYLEQHDKAQKNIEGAKNIYSNSLGADHPSTEDVNSVLKQLPQSD